MTPRTPATPPFVYLCIYVDLTAHAGCRLETGKTKGCLCTRLFINQPPCDLPTKVALYFWPEPFLSYRRWLWYSKLDNFKKVRYNQILKLINWVLISLSPLDFNQIQLEWHVTTASICNSVMDAFLSLSCSGIDRTVCCNFKTTNKRDNVQQDSRNLYRLYWLTGALLRSASSLFVAPSAAINARALLVIIAEATVRKSLFYSFRLRVNKCNKSRGCFFVAIGFTTLLLVKRDRAKRKLTSTRDGQFIPSLLLQKSSSISQDKFPTEEKKILYLVSGLRSLSRG